MSNIYYQNKCLTRTICKDTLRLDFIFQQIILGKYVLFVYNRKPQSNDAL